MTRIGIARGLVASTLLALAVPGPAFAAGGCLPQARDGWIRLVPAMPMQAGFVRIDNPCGQPARVTAVRSGLHGQVSIHRTELVGGVSRMREIPVLELPAHGSVILQPGGLHLMLLQPRRELKVGERVTLQIELGDGRRLKVPFEVRALQP